MTLRVITKKMVKLSSEHYESLYRTIDLQMPPEIDFSNVMVLGVEVVDDATNTDVGPTAVEELPETE